MKIITVLFICLFTGKLLFGQTEKYITAGSIEYDKTVNTYALAQAMVKANANSSFGSIYAQGFEQYQKTHDQFTTVKSVLTFGSNKSLFTPLGSGDNTAGYLGSNLIAQQFNTVYTNFETNSRLIQKNVFDKQFLLSDSTSKIKWKIVGNSDDIAGYPCHEAHGLIQDSIYVVAFFTDKIWVSGGPESFSGLPGMILKVVLPHEHVTWTATKVTAEDTASKPVIPPVKGKPVNTKQFMEILKPMGRNLKYYLL